jgi:lysophospholipase L1-like esterase
MADDSPAKESTSRETTPFRLTLPPEIYAVPDVELNVFFENTILKPADVSVQFSVDCRLGKSDERKWSFTPTSTDVGSVSLTLHLKDEAGALIDSATTNVIIAPADAGKGREIRLLIIGDSLTHASVYPNEIAKLLSLPGNPQWKMLGTHVPSGAAANVAHEGYGGWTWAAFNSKFSADISKPGNSSPFVFADEQGKPALNVKRYLEERCNGQFPDFIVIKLGINDCFGFDSADPVKLDSQIDGVFLQAEKLLTEIRQAAPNAQIGLCLTTPGNSRDEAFVANYKDRYTRWGWRQIQHRLVERQMKAFSERRKDNLFVIPTELNLDVIDGYPANNAVHPNPQGYQQIGRTIFAWLKWRLSETDSKADAPTASGKK